MSTAPLTSATPADKTARHSIVLDDLIDLGHELARLVVDQAKAKTLPAMDATIAFERVARSIRRCIALARKLAEPIRVADPVAARKRIIRAVEDTIQRHTDAPEAETLHEELLDRLDAPDLDDEIGDRKVEDIIADIVRDLGLDIIPGAHPWKRRTPGDVALLCARAARQIPRGIAVPAAQAAAAPPGPPYRQAAG